MFFFSHQQPHKIKARTFTGLVGSPELEDNIFKNITNKKPLIKKHV